MAEQHTAASGRRIRVCLVVPKLEIGGGEVICLIKHLDRSRFEVSLLCLASGDAEMEMETRQYLKSFTTAGFRWRYFPLSLARMIAWLRRGRYDVVHCHMPMADVIGRFAGWLAGVPVLITTEHGKHIGKPWYHLLMERLLNPLTDMRICVSQDILEIRARRERTPRSRFSTSGTWQMRSGVSTPTFVGESEGVLRLAGTNALNVAMGICCHGQFPAPPGGVNVVPNEESA